MTVAARAWLPANALTDATVQTLVQKCASAWAKRWLPDPRDNVASRHQHAPPTRIPDIFMCWANGARTITLAIDDASVVRLATQMIGAPAGNRLNAADRDLYRRLVQSCCRDLMVAMAALFESDREIDAAGQHEVSAETKYTLSWPSGGPTLDIYVDSALIMRARRSAAANPRPGVTFGAMREAVGRQEIRLGAAIGAATIGLDELLRLGLGDVIVLDRALEGGVPLTINNRVVSVASALIQRSEAGLELRMMQMGLE